MLHFTACADTKSDLVTVYKFTAKYVNHRAGPQNKCHSWQYLRAAAPHRAHSRCLLGYQECLRMWTNWLLADVFRISSLKVAFSCETVTSLLAEAQTINYLHWIYSKNSLFCLIFCGVYPAVSSSSIIGITHAAGKPPVRIVNADVFSQVCGASGLNQLKLLIV